MNCEGARESLSAYLDEALAPDERNLLDAHLAGCAACHRELEALRGTVAMLRRVEPPRAPVGFVDRAVAAARPRPWFRRVAEAVLLPLSIKLPLEAAAVVMVGLLAVYLFERTPELQQAAREVAPRPEPAAPAKERPAGLADQAPPAPAPSTPAPAEAPAQAAGERDRAAAPRSQDVDRQITVPPSAGAPAAPALSAPSAASPPPPLAAPPPERQPQAKREAAPSENVAGAFRPEVESRERARPPAAGADSARADPSSAGPAAKRVLPPADVVARVAVQDRDAAERELTTLIARLGGSVTRRWREDEVTVVEAVIPQPRYGEFSAGVARIGTWRVEAERPDLPAQVHVILRLR